MQFKVGDHVRLIDSGVQMAINLDTGRSQDYAGLPVQVYTISKVNDIGNSIQIHGFPFWYASEEFTKINITE